MDPALTAVLISAFVGLLSGAAGGYFSPLGTWHAERKRRRFENRKEVIQKCRNMVTDTYDRLNLQQEITTGTSKREGENLIEQQKRFIAKHPSLLDALYGYDAFHAIRPSLDRNLIANLQNVETQQEKGTGQMPEELDELLNELSRIERDEWDLL